MTYLEASSLKCMTKHIFSLTKHKFRCTVKNYNTFTCELKSLDPPQKDTAKSFQGRILYMDDVKYYLAQSFVSSTVKN